MSEALVKQDNEPQPLSVLLDHDASYDPDWLYVAFMTGWIDDQGRHYWARNVVDLAQILHLDRVAVKYLASVHRPDGKPWTHARKDYREKVVRQELKRAAKNIAQAQIDSEAELISMCDSVAEGYELQQMMDTGSIVSTSEYIRAGEVRQKAKARAGGFDSEKGGTGNVYIDKIFNTVMRPINPETGRVDADWKQIGKKPEIIEAEVVQDGDASPAA